MQLNTIKYYVIKFHWISLNTNEYYRIPKYHRIQCNTIEYHQIQLNAIRIPSDTIKIQCAIHGATSISDGIFMSLLSSFPLAPVRSEWPVCHPLPNGLHPSLLQCCRNNVMDGRWKRCSFSQHWRLCSSRCQASFRSRTSIAHRGMLSFLVARRWVGWQLCPQLSTIKFGETLLNYPQLR